MPVGTFDFTTGPTTLPDVGRLFYNGCTFGPWFVSTVSGKVVQDNAQRTTKLMEYRITVDGFVTLEEGFTDISNTMEVLQGLLQQQGGELIYEGRGFDLHVNAPGLSGAVKAGQYSFAVKDVAWGPVPELIDFQPLGSGHSAKIKWAVVTRVFFGNGAKGGSLLQYNVETVVSYGEDGFSSLSVRGTMEIPLTRIAQNNRIVPTTVDSFRSELDTRLFKGIDLTRFRVVRRNYPVSRDKRTMEFDVQVEEKPYMDLPPGCTIANGSFNVRPATTGMGLANWLCTLRCSYIVKANESRRVAYWAFLALLRLRMAQSIFGYNLPNVGANDNSKSWWVGLFSSTPGLNTVAAAAAAIDDLRTLSEMVKQYVSKDATRKQLEDARAQNKNQKSTVNPDDDLEDLWRKNINRSVLLKDSGAPVNSFIVDFSFDEGLYQDSKQMSFSATWRLVTTFEFILIASGIWRKVPEKDTAGGNLWATSMKNVSGSNSWFNNVLTPTKDVIVDYGEG